MYQSFFGLKRRPFSFTPDAESYFPTESMEKTLQLTERTIQKGEGISLIFGSAGTGKTLFMHLLLKSLTQQPLETPSVVKKAETELAESLPESSPHVVLVSHSPLETPKALFMQLGYDLDIPLSGNETTELRLMLLDAVQKRFPQGMILLFDDAQHLSPSVLEEIRLLTDSVRRTVHLFRVVFAGTIDFEEKLTIPHLDAFNQRVVSRCYLDSFTSEETVRYILHETDELRTALPDVPSLFTKEAQKQVHTLTDGIPRLVNQLCSAALQLAVKEDLPSVDVTLLRNAWGSLQHREQAEESIEETQVESAVETVISPKEIEEIVDRKRNTFQIRHFDSVEFGTLTDTEPAVEETNLTDSCSADSDERSTLVNEYKPAFPEDDDDDWEEDRTEHRVLSPKVILKIHVPDEETFEEEKPAEAILLEEVLIPDSFADNTLKDDPFVDNAAAENALKGNLAGNSESTCLPFLPVFPKKRLIPNYDRQCRRIRRRHFSQKIQRRLGLFVGLLQKSESISMSNIFTESEHVENDMDVQTLQEYHAAVLKSRHPFVRKEPHYAYQTTNIQASEPAALPIPYPDPKTGAPITLCWLSDSSEKTGRFGVSYSEFLKKETSHVADIDETPSNSVIPFPQHSLSTETPLSETSSVAVAAPVTFGAPVVRTSFHASQDCSVLSLGSGLEETFDESQEVSNAVISLAELFRSHTSVLQQFEDFRESNTKESDMIDESVQQQLNKIVRRLIQATEKIEKAAEASEKAGKKVSQSAEYVASEVCSAVPTCRELFRKLSDFQEMISEELETLRDKKREPTTYRSLPLRHQVMIERALPTIDIDLLLR